MASPVSATAGYRFNHTMLRIKDPKRSLQFYTEVLGMTLFYEMPVEQGKFTNYFLAYTDAGETIETDPSKRHAQLFGRQGVVELCHNWGTESDDAFTYHNGNKEPRGFGHLCIAVPDLEVACKRFTELGVHFIKRPEDGMMRGIAFITDPDGYWIEILSPHAAPTVPAK